MPLAIAIAVAARPARPSGLDDFERVLLPVVMTTEVMGENDVIFAARAAGFAWEPLRYFPRYVLTEPGTFRAETGSFGGSDGPGNFFQPSPPSRLGRLLYLDRASSSSSFLADILSSRLAADAPPNEGRLPVVRETDFLTGPAAIPFVVSSYVYEGDVCRTATPKERHRLRVYDVDALGTAEVMVTLYDENLLDVLLEEFTLPLSSREGNDASYPAYGEVVIEELCHPFSCHTPCRGGSQRVEIVPTTPGLRYWAMVSATDNATGVVQVAAP